MTYTYLPRSDTAIHVCCHQSTVTMTGKDEPPKTQQPAQGKLSGHGLADFDSDYIKHLRQQIHYLELENEQLRRLLGMDVPNASKLTEQPDMLERLQKSQSSREQAEVQLKKKNRVIEDLQKTITYLQQTVKTSDEQYARDRRALTDEVVELRKRLDDFTPEIAKKEAHLIAVQIDLREAENYSKQMQQSFENLQTQLDQKSREEQFLQSLDGQRKQEMRQILDNVNQLECSISEERSGSMLLKEEIGQLRKQLKEQELYVKKEKAVAERISEENATIIKENASLTAQLSQLEAFQKDLAANLPQVRCQEEKTLSELIQLRDQEKDLRYNLFKLHEELRLEQQKNRQCNAQVAEADARKSAWKEAEEKFKLELSKVNNFSFSLSTENKQLRENMAQLQQSIEGLKRSVTEKDRAVSNIEERYYEFQEKYKKLEKVYEGELKSQADKRKEFEKLASQVRELARSTVKSRPGDRSEISITSYYEEKPS